MKKFTVKLFVLGLFIFAFQACNEPLVNEDPLNEAALKSANASKVSYIVVLNDANLNLELSGLKGYEKRQAAMKTATSKILKRTGISDGEVHRVYGTAIKGFSVMIPPGQLKKLQDDPSVNYVEKNQKVTLIHPTKKPSGTPGGGNNGGGGSTGQEIPWGITRVKGTDTVSYSGDNVAWIIDTGVDLDHPDLNVDASRGALFARAKSFDDDNGHGTHVAGTIAAINNDFGVIGVAPGATVIPVKVLDRHGSGWYDDVIAGVNYVEANGASGDVANMSLGGPPSQALDDAVIAASAKVKFAIAAGNDDDFAGNYSPARITDNENIYNNIYTISAMDSNNKFASWSNWGNPPVDYCEPGVNITSTWKDGGYNTISGTSMATPHLAGILLLGSVKSGGTVSGDPDENADTIGVH